MKYTVLYFGSFNPVHRGHALVAQSVLHNDLADTLWWVPSPQSPFKSSFELLPFIDRVAMLRLVVKKLGENFEVCDIERHLPEPNYTLKTLNLLSEKYPDHEFSLLIGQDNLEQLSKWKGFSEIREGYSFIVFPRSHSAVKNSFAVQKIPESLLKKVTLLNETNIPISSTQIREWLKNPMEKEEHLRRWLEEEVWEYIVTQKLVKRTDEKWN